MPEPIFSISFESFKALGEALLNTLRFFLAQVGVAIQLHLALCVNHALDMNTKLSGSFNQHRICLIELPMAFAAYHQIVVMIFHLLFFTLKRWPPAIYRRFIRPWDTHIRWCKGIYIGGGFSHWRHRVIDSLGSK